MFFRAFSLFFFALILVVCSFQVFASNDEVTGCNYFSNILEKKKGEIESISEGLKKENAYGYAYINTNQCLNPQLYVDKKSKEATTEAERGLWEKWFGSKGKGEEETLSVSPELSYKCNWVKELESSVPNSLLVQADSCTGEKQDFIWPDEIDWLIAPYILEKLSQVRKQSPSTNSQICDLKGMLYPYRFWRDAYIVTVPSYNEEEALGFKIRDELMKPDGCINKGGKFLNTALEVPAKTKNHNRATKNYALHIEGENKFEMAALEEINYRVTALKEGAELTGEYKVEPEAKSHYLSFSLDDELDFKGSEKYNYKIKYDGESRWFIANICSKAKYDTKTEKLNVSECKLIGLNKNNKINFLIKLENNDTKNIYTISTSISPTNGTISNKGFSGEEGSECIINYNGGIEKRDPRRLYYSFFDNAKNLADYMYLQEEAKEMVQRNIHKCNKKVGGT